MEYASIRDYLSVVRQQRVLLVLSVLLLGGGAYLWSESSEKKYRAEASLSCQRPTQNVELIGIAAFSDQLPEERAAVCAERAGERSLLQRVKRRLRIDESIEKLESDVTARAEVRTNLVVIEAENTDPRLAAAIANGLAREVARSERRVAQRRYDELIDATRREYRTILGGKDPFTLAERREFERRLVQLRTTRDYTRPVQISENAVVPGDPFSPKVIRNTVLGVGAGLLIGLMLAFLRSALDRRLRTSKEIEAEARLPLLATVRESALGKANFGDPATGQGDAEKDLEAFRILQTNLDYTNVDRPPRRILVTSPLPEEGKSTVAASLAVVAALAGRRVLLVEADLRRPSLAGWLGVDKTPGLADHVAGKAGPGEVIRAVAVTPGATNGAAAGAEGSQVVSVIVAGTLPPRPAELLRSKRFADFASTASHAYDLVVFDSPPLLPVTDALDLVEHVDAIALCVRSGQTTRDQLRSAVEALHRLPERPTGIVVTGVSGGTEGDYGYYRYSYGQTAGA